MTPRTNPDDYLIPCAYCGRPTLPGFHSSGDMYVICGKCNSPDDLDLLEKEQMDAVLESMQRSINYKKGTDRVFNQTDDIDEYNRLRIDIFIKAINP